MNTDNDSSAAKKKLQARAMVAMGYPVYRTIPVNLGPFYSGEGSDFIFI